MRGCSDARIFEPGALAERHEPDADGDEVGDEGVEISGECGFEHDVVRSRNCADRDRIGRTVLERFEDRGMARPRDRIEKGAALRHRLKLPLARRRERFG